MALFIREVTGEYAFPANVVDFYLDFPDFRSPVQEGKGAGGRVRIDQEPA